MTNRQRVQAILDGKPVDRLPMIEWASYWDLTIRNWEKSGLPEGLNQQEITNYFNLDPLYQLWIPPRSGDCPSALAHGQGIVSCEDDYEAILPYLYKQEILDHYRKSAEQIRTLHQRGDGAVWLTLEGFFWFPRTLFGIEQHLYAFYDQPELMHRINRDLAAFNQLVVETICDILTPEFMTFAEDMSYNHGPMLSKQLYDEFMAPYYHQVIPLLKERGVKVLIDTDGNVEPLIPWFMESGIEGVLPLERQAGVDVNRIRQNYPEWLMVGGFDKTIMHLGEAALRAEFERLLPAMRSGRYIPSVDHQTPPAVSIEDYRLYVMLLEEYAGK